MKLYSYFRSSAAYRVRIALNLKGLDYQTIPVHLLRDGGEQLSDSYRGINPSALVPTLAQDDLVLGQSLAILEYLDETHPAPALLPEHAAERARVRSIAQVIACDTHPLNNLRVLKYLKQQLNVDEDAKNAWYRHWIALGLQAVERLLAESPATGAYCHGEQPTIADLCLVPQVYNARRFGCSLDEFPTILRIDAQCNTLPAFQDAAPESQPDAQA
jgi:maleylpyruvate isomerase